jgi:MYXO-CTERM domain-containing protein
MIHSSSYALPAIVTAFLLCLAMNVSASAAESCDRPHIQTHLSLVIDNLNSADVSGLSAEQRQNRATHIDRLESYRDRCEFPENHRFQNRISPIFVDEDGTHCAMGHLLALDGETSLVEEIRENRNTASIWELADNEELQAWLQKSGLSLYEAARVQPGYCSSAGDCYCFAGGSMDVILIGEIVALEDSDTFDREDGRMQVEEVYGTEQVETDDIVNIEIDQSDDFVGRRVIIAYSSSVSRSDEQRNLYPYTLTSDEVQCQTAGFDMTTVPLETYVAALRADDCIGQLGSYDSSLAEEECDTYYDEACSSTGKAPGYGFGILGLAFFTMLRVRRRR